MKKLFFVICLLGALGWGTANNIISNDNITIRANSTNGNDRSSSISAYIDGHNLTVAFLNEVGHVLVKTEDESGTILDLYYTETPAGYLYYIPDAGHYLLTIIFGNGDESYGEFDVVE